MRWDEGLHHGTLQAGGALGRVDDRLQAWRGRPWSWATRRALSPLAELGWLAGGTPPARIGYGTGPLQAARERRRRREDRPLRVCLLEEFRAGAPRFANAHAHWMNRGSTLCTAVVNDPEGSDVVWVFSQDPLEPAARARLDATVAALPPGTVVLNPPATYDAYHDDDAFDRLRAAGVGVPRTAFGPADLGRTPVVHKAAGEQAGTMVLRPWAGPLPRARAFAYVDGSGPDGLHWRYRAFYAAGVIAPFNGYGGPAWEVRYATRIRTDLAFALTGEERRQIATIAEVLGLDWFAVDFLRRRGDGAPVFVDVNVYPTIVSAPAIDRALGSRGRWHVLDLRARLGIDPPGTPTFWQRLDDALLARVGAATGRTAPVRAPAALRSRW